MMRLEMPASDDPSRDYDGRWRRLFAPRTGDLRLELSEEAADYLGIPVAGVVDRLPGAAERFAQEWRDRGVADTDVSAVTAFYNESETELFDLLEWHATDPANQRAIVCADLLRAHLAARATRNASRLPTGRETRPRVLDYGSGVGTVGLVFADAGCDVTLADVADPLLAFAQWRFHRRGIPASTIDLKRRQPERGAYDAIVCFDVLEHIPRPLRAVRRLRAALRPGGLLFLVAQFGADPLRPMHVVHDDGVFDWFRALGFRERDDMEDWFPPVTWGGRPDVYERARVPAWKRGAYLLHDVLLPEGAASVLRATWSRLRA